MKVLGTWAHGPRAHDPWAYDSWAHESMDMPAWHVLSVFNCEVFSVLITIFDSTFLSLELDIFLDLALEIEFSVLTFADFLENLTANKDAANVKKFPMISRKIVSHRLDM